MIDVSSLDLAQNRIFSELGGGERGEVSKVFVGICAQSEAPRSSFEAHISSPH